MLAVYMDAAFSSLPEQLAAAAVEAPRIGLCPATRLLDNRSIKGSELKAIQCAIRTVLDNEGVRPKKLVLFTDSIPALQESRKRNLPSCVVKGIKISVRLLDLGTRIRCRGRRRTPR